MPESIFHREDPREIRRRSEKTASFLISLVTSGLLWGLTLWRPELPAALRAAIAMLVPTLLVLAVRRRLNGAREPRDGLGPEIR